MEKRLRTEVCEWIIFSQYQISKVWGLPVGLLAFGFMGFQPFLLGAQTP